MESLTQYEQLHLRHQVQSLYPVFQLRYPSSVIFFLATRFFELLGLAGVKSILSLYLKKKLEFSEDRATTIYHAFSCLALFTPILGAWLADQFLGKFKTIVSVSFLLIIGQVLITLAAVPGLGVDPQ